MMKTLLSLFIAVLVVGGTVSQPALASQGDRQVPTVEAVKSKIARQGIGSKAKVTIRLKNGTKVKGYVAQAEENDFVIRDRKTDAPTTIRYEDVLKVEENRGHSTARNIAIGVAVGVGAVLAVIGILISTLDD
jgi:preprotein translocase subunit SecF